MGNDDFKLPRLEEKPLPEEHAEYVIRRLEKFIRDGRTLDEGMSFRKWQFMAKKEIALAIAEAQNAHKFDEINSRRALFISAAALTTIGFWGTAISMERVAYLPGGIVCLIAGLTMLFVEGVCILQMVIVWAPNESLYDMYRRVAALISSAFRSCDGALQRCLHI